MIPIGQKTFTVKASLFFGLAFLLASGCQKDAVVVGNQDQIPSYHTIHSQASYPGGAKAWNNFLKQNLRYPKTQTTIAGKVLLKTFIDSTGEVTEVEVIRSLHPLFDDEAKRLVLASGQWNPATYQGKPVDGSVVFFIYFRHH